MRKLLALLFIICSHIGNVWARVCEGVGKRPAMKWGQPSAIQWGTKASHGNSDYHSTCECPRGVYVNGICGIWDDKYGLRGFTSKCATRGNTAEWEDSYGWVKSGEKWQCWNTKIPICGVKVAKWNDGTIVAMKFVNAAGEESKLFGPNPKGSRTWYEEKCGSVSKDWQTSRQLVGWEIVTYNNIEYFRASWDYPKCDPAHHVSISGFYQHPGVATGDLWEMTYIDKVNAGVFQQLPTDPWISGSPVYKLSGAEVIAYRQANGGTWAITTKSDYDAGKHNTQFCFNLQFMGTCFQDMNRNDHQRWKLGFNNKKTKGGPWAYSIAGDEGHEIDFQLVSQVPVVYDENHAEWRTWSSSGELEYQMTIQNVQKDATVSEKEQQRKFGNDFKLGTKFSVGPGEVSAGYAYSQEKSDAVKNGFTEAITSSNGFSRTCKPDIRGVSHGAPYVIWAWTYFRSRTDNGGVDSMQSCDVFVKSGLCRSIPPNCIPGGCVMPDCHRCIDPSYEIMPEKDFEGYILGKQVGHGLDGCFQYTAKKCNPAKGDFNCCKKLRQSEDEQCQAGEGGCQQDHDCVRGTVCTPNSGDLFGGQHSMSICMHSRLAALRTSTGNQGAIREAEVGAEDEDIETDNPYVSAIGSMFITVGSDEPTDVSLLPGEDIRCAVPPKMDPGIKGDKSTNSATVVQELSPSQEDSGSGSAIISPVVTSADSALEQQEVKPEHVAMSQIQPVSEWANRKEVLRITCFIFFGMCLIAFFAFKNSKNSNDLRTPLTSASKI